MHDVQELHFPEFFTPQDRLSRAELYWGAVSQASRVVVSFDHVKEDLLRYFRLSEERVVVLPVPYSECGFPDLEDVQDAEVSRKYSDLGMYYLYPAQTWRHKNHLGLIEAFERVRSEYPGRVNLVCTGVKNEYYQEAIHQRVERSPVRDSIHFLGVVSAAELKWLYRNSMSVVVPSLYEAGSFPLIEAMQLQMPVLCSSTTSLPATIGDERFVFDPRDAGQMGSMMLRMAVDEEYRQQGIKNSALRAEELRQIKVGPIVEDLWRSTLEQSRRES
jgi:glycosyltransferase involved in cell wall biosynthesis